MAAAYVLFRLSDYRDCPLPVSSQLVPSVTRLPVYAAKLLILRYQAVFWEFLLNPSTRRAEVLHTPHAPSGSAKLAMVTAHGSVRPLPLTDAKVSFT